MRASTTAGARWAMFLAAPIVVLLASAAVAVALTRPAPPPRPAPTATLALPHDCAELYGTDDLAVNARRFGPLNDPGVVGGELSRYPEVEERRAALPGFACYWGAATEGGVQTTVNTADAAELEAVRAELDGLGFQCVEEGTGSLCTRAAEDRVHGEWHLLRDGLWVATWWAYIDIDDYTARLLHRLPAADNAPGAGKADS